MHALPPREACDLVIGRHCDRGDCGNRGGGRRIGDECREVKLQPGKLQARNIPGPKIADQAHLDRGSGRMFYLKLRSRRNLSSCDSALATPLLSLWIWWHL